MRKHLVATYFLNQKRNTSISHLFKLLRKKSLRIYHVEILAGGSCETSAKKAAELKLNLILLASNISFTTTQTHNTALKYLY